jgi:tetratricopeptide (TPR) repeat protein
MDARQAGLLKEIAPEVLGQRVRDARVAQGLTQGQVAGADMTVGYVSRIEAGQRRPDAKILEVLATRLQTTVSHLLLGVSSREYDELRLALDYAELSLESGEWLEAEQRAAAALERGAVETLDDLRDRARYLHGRALEAQGRLEEAIADLEQVLGRPDGGAIALAAGIALSRCYREAGDLTRAIQVGESVLARLSDVELSGSDEAVQLVVTVAAAYFERGDVTYAVRLCRLAIDRAEDLGSPVSRASAYWNASMMEAERGGVAAAIPMAEKALALFGEGRDARNLARLRMQLGIMQLQSDPPAVREAEANLEQARSELTASSASAVDLARCKLGMARTHFLGGELEQARVLSAEAAEDTEGTAPILAADASVLQGQVAAAQGDIDAATASYRRAVLLLTGVGADRLAGQLWFELGGLFDAVGDGDSARDAYRSAAASVGVRSRTSATVRV